MRRADAVEDLLVLARDRELSEEDSARLGRAVESSLELKLLLDAGYGCDAQTRLLPGDEAKMQRLVERVMQQVDAGAAGGEPATPRVASVYRERIGLRRARPMLLAAAACLLPVGMAVAWQVVERSTGASPPDTPAASASAPTAPRTPSRTGRNGWARHEAGPTGSDAAPAPAPHAPEADNARVDPALTRPAAAGSASERAVATVPAKPRSSERKRAADPDVQPSGGQRATAAELFAGANLARREGHIERAVQLYEQLIQAYPESMEAADAHTVLGKLELDRAPASAVWQFRQSRARGSTAEALWGEAESLRRMASPEERAVLERIVREFPNSPYAPAARARLTKLAP